VSVSEFRPLALEESKSGAGDDDDDERWFVSSELAGAALLPAAPLDVDGDDGETGLSGDLPELEARGRLSSCNRGGSFFSFSGHCSDVAGDLSCL